LRILAAVSGALLLFIGTERLFLQLALPDPYNSVGLFCLLSSQMIWATLAHVGNDWLAVPIAVWVLVALNRFDAMPSRRSAVVAAIALASGLLTKAYFLAFVPLLIAVCVVRRRWRDLGISSAILGALAGPWYARNFVLYGVLTGTQESRAGIGLSDVLRAAPALHWPAVIWSSIHSALWTGNNTFSTFSSGTLNVIVVLSCVALLLWAAGKHSGAEWITLSFCALFILALGYSAVASHIFTQGAANGPSPWYAQPLVAPLLGLTLLGASRWRGFDRFLAALLVVMFGYVLAATYVVKLIPLYAGFDGRMSLPRVTSLYVHQLGTLAGNLNTVALAPAGAIFALSGVVIILMITQVVMLLHALIRSSRAGETVYSRPSDKFQNPNRA
jgi:hypothetical protein